jgi:VanZ family protein
VDVEIPTVGPRHSGRVQTQSRSQASRVIDVALWTASFGLLVLSFLFSWGTPPEFGPDVDWVDKLWHFLGYGAFTGTLLLAAVWRPGRGTGRFPQAGLLVAGSVVAVAWLTEGLQAPFDRDVELLDAVADLAGVTAAFLGWRVTQRMPPT